MASTPERRQYFGLLAMIAGLLLIFMLFCLALLSVRFFSFPPGRSGRNTPGTEYVDAWKLAGERFELAEQDRRDDEPPSENPPDEEGKDEGGGRPSR